MKRFPAVCAAMMICAFAFAQQQNAAIEMKVDKKIIYPDKLGYSPNTSLIEILQILPELINRTSGELMPNYSVELDDKDVGGAKDAVLAQTRLAEIDFIEVTTNPSASQQNSGQGGKVNVKLRPISDGISGSVNLNVSSDPDVAPSVYMGYKNKGLELRASLMMEYYAPSSERQYEQLSYREKGDSHRTLFLQDEKLRKQFIGQTAKFNLQYKFSDKDIFNAWLMETGTYGSSAKNMLGESHTAIQDNSIFRFRYGEMKGTDKDNKTNLSAMFKHEHIFADASKIIAEFSYTYTPSFSATSELRSGEFYMTGNDSALEYCSNMKRYGRVHTATSVLKHVRTFRFADDHSILMESGLNADNMHTATSECVIISNDGVDDLRDATLGRHSIWYISPYTEWNYTWKQLEAKFSMRYQYQNRKLNFDNAIASQISDAGGKASIDNHDITANLSLFYKFNDRHHLRTMLARNLLRPSDNQVFPGVLLDVKNNTIYSGEGLGNTHAYSAELDYVFQMDRQTDYIMFDAGLRYIRMTDMVESNKSKELWQGYNTYVRFVNAGSANLVTLDLSLYYRYRNFSFVFANNYFAGPGTFYYNMSLTPVCNLPKDWTLSGSLIYNSKVSQRQSYLGDCFYAQIRVSKGYGKWRFHAALNDIFRYRTVDKTIYSANEYEQVSYNLRNRALELGVGYVF